MTCRSARNALMTIFLGLLVAAPLAAQGVELKASATVYFGSASTCSQPATIDFDRVREATPEWETIRSEGVKKGSARYTLLMTEMNARIQRACRKVAEDAGKDCVVGHRDIKSDNGLKVADISDAVIEKLESGVVAP